MTVDYIGYIFAFCIAVGGIIGYVKAGSVPSIIAGSIFGVILIYGAYRASVDPYDVYVSLGATVILGIVMAARYYTTEKFMPAGVIVILCLLMILKYSYQIISKPDPPIESLPGTSSTINDTSKQN